MWCCDSDYGVLSRDLTSVCQADTERNTPASSGGYNKVFILNSFSFTKSWMVLCCEQFLPKSKDINEIFNNDFLGFYEKKIIRSSQQ